MASPPVRWTIPSGSRKPGQGYPCVTDRPAVVVPAGAGVSSRGPPRRQGHPAGGHLAGRGSRKTTHQRHHQPVYILPSRHNQRVKCLHLAYVPLRYREFLSLLLSTPSLTPPAEHTHILLCFLRSHPSPSFLPPSNMIANQ